MTRRVLLVEDSPVAREKVSGILRELGCEVLRAENGVEGLKVATQNAASIDLIVLDIQMPKADGLTLLRYLRKVPDLASIRVVMLTTQADKETVKTALTLGAKDFLRKDATIAHITERLRLHVDNDADTASGPPRTNEDRQALVRQLLRGGAGLGDIEGPCVLCHVPSKEIEEFTSVSGARQLDLYLAVAAGVAEMNRRYPRLHACYMIESQATEVSRHLKRGELVPWVLLLARRSEGLSVAKMIGLAGLHAGRMVHMVCDPIALVPDRDKDSVQRMGAVLIEQKSFYDGGCLPLMEAHLLPRPQPVGDGVYRELAAGTQDRVRPGQKVVLHYAAVCRDGDTRANTFAAGEPERLPYADERLPGSLWAAIAQMGRGGRALVDLLAAGQDEAVYYSLELMDIIP